MRASPARSRAPRPLKPGAALPGAVTLDTLQPTPTWEPEAHPDVVEAFAALAADESAVVRA